MMTTGGWMYKKQNNGRTYNDNKAICNCNTTVNTVFCNCAKPSHLSDEARAKVLQFL